MEQNKGAYMVGIVFIVLFLGLIFKVIPDINNSPTPNKEYFDEVVEWSGREPCCDMTWLDMCIGYKEEKNVSFECFT